MRSATSSSPASRATGPGSPSTTDAPASSPSRRRIARLSSYIDRASAWLPLNWRTPPSELSDPATAASSPTSRRISSASRQIRSPSSSSPRSSSISPIWFSVAAASPSRPEPDAEPERLVEPRHGPLEVALDRVEDAGAVERPGPVGRLLRRPHPERGVEPQAALGEAAADAPVLGQRAGRRTTNGRVAVGAGPVEDREQVVVDGVELRERVRAGLLDDLGVAPLRERQQVVRVGPVRGGGLAALGEPPRGVVADDPEELEAGFRRLPSSSRRTGCGAGSPRRSAATALVRVDRRRREAVLDRAIEVSTAAARSRTCR